MIGIDMEKIDRFEHWTGEGLKRIFAVQYYFYLEAQNDFKRLFKTRERGLRAR